MLDYGIYRMVAFCMASRILSATNHYFKTASEAQVVDNPAITQQMIARANDDETWMVYVETILAMPNLVSKGSMRGIEGSFVVDRQAPLASVFKIAAELEATPAVYKNFPMVVQIRPNQDDGLDWKQLAGVEEANRSCAI